MAVPYTFGSATTSIPLSQLDSNFATTITLGNTAIQLGNTVTTLNNMTLGNVTVSSGNVVAGIASSTITQSMLASGVAGNGPTFSVLGTSPVSFSSATATKVPFNGSTQWDTASCYSTANHRFTPNVAGYYQVNANAGCDVTTGTASLCWVYKNGSSYKRGFELSLSVGNFNTIEPTVSCIVYMNGSTDYIEIYAYCAGTSPNFNGDRWFDASLIRSA